MTQLQDPETQVPDATSLVGEFADYTPVEEGFGTPFIDVDEPRTSPVPHRYVHGGFKETRTLFSFYLPTAEQFQGRVLQYLEGGSGGHENLLQPMGADVDIFGALWQYKYAFDEMGAVLIESNQGHGPTDGGRGFENDTYLFGASAESARFAKWLAQRLYGAPVHHCYVFGCSGGGHRSFQCIMRRPDVYDGGVPEVFGVNPGPYWSAMGNAVEVLGKDVLRVQDALEPGGSGDPFEGLSYPQREALRDLLQMGFPRDGSTQMAHMGPEPFTLYNTMEHTPEYFTNFWSKRGFIGHDAPDRLQGRLMQFTTTVKAVHTGAELSSEFMVAMALASAGAQPLAGFGALLDVDEPHKLFMAKLTVRSGKAAGREMYVTRVLDDGVVLPFAQKCPEMFDDVQPGDEIDVDNRDWLAFCHLYQHSVEWNIPGLHTDGRRVPSDYERFAVDGNPVHIQSPAADYPLDLVDPWPGKMIYIGAVLDICIWPTIVGSFDEYVRSVMGDRIDDHYRLWWVENCTHVRAEMPMMFTPEKDPRVWRTRLVDYEGVGAAALTAVRNWVEEGVAPPASDRYEMTADKHIVFPDDADERGGIQPVVRLRVNGGTRADVKVGQTVTFEGTGQVASGAGTVVKADMDFDSTDTWPFQQDGVDGTSRTVSVDATHSYDRPGTYFPVLRVVTSEGTADGAERVRNLARVRVVVTD
jgi:hypothetical protein